LPFVEQEPLHDLQLGKTGTAHDAAADNCRWVGTTDDVPTSYFVPTEEEPGYYSIHWHMFGSAHGSGCNFVLCDGSVRLISYAIDAEIHRRLGNRMDDQPIDGKNF